MRKFYMASLCLLFASVFTGLAQGSFGLKAGIGASNMGKPWFSKFGNLDPSYSLESLTSYGFGVLYEAPMGPVGAVIPELMFQRTGGQGNIFDNGDYGQIKLSRITLGVTFRGYTGPQKRFGFDIGAQTGLLVDQIVSYGQFPVR